MLKRMKKTMTFLMTLVMVMSLVCGNVLSTSAGDIDSSREIMSGTEGPSTEASGNGEEYVSQESVQQGEETAVNETAGGADAGESMTEPVTSGGQTAEQTTEEPVVPEQITEKTTEAADSGQQFAGETVQTEEAASEAVTEQESSEAGTEKESNSTEQASEDETAGEEITEAAETAEEETEEETTGEEELTEQELAASGCDAAVILRGKMPAGAKAEAKEVQVEIEGKNVLAAYDITIYDEEGQVYQPEEGTIRVEIRTPKVEAAVDQEQEISVYHMETTAANPEEVQTVTPTAEGVAFEAEHFSIYVVTEPETHYTLTYEFYADRADTEPVNRQILSEGEVLQRPETPAGKDHEAFIGWYTDTETGETEFTGFGMTTGKLNESRIVKIYAKYHTAYYVFYKAANEEASKVFFTQKYQSGASIQYRDVPFSTGDVDTALVGWTTESGGTQPMTDLAVTDSDVTLYPVVKAAHWITFDSMGGSAADPAYVLTGSPTVAPPAPTKAGYSFAGWFTDEQCTAPFAFDSTLERNLTLYAGWTAGEVSYRVVYWQQNPDDDGYSYESSESRSGKTGTVTTVTAESNKYGGFEPSRKKTVLNQTISGDGSTVVNVYYDRIEYRISFYRYQWTGIWSGEWRVIDELTITAKYGQDISKLWPSRKTGLSIQYPSNWKVSSSQSNMTCQSGIATMPLDGDEFYWRDESGRYTIRTEYRTQSLDGRKYEIDHRDEFRSDNHNWTTTKEDYYSIKGFTVNDKKSAGVGETASGKWDGETSVYGWIFYYDRNSYKINFVNEGEDDSQKFYLYEADISGAYHVPSAPAGKEDYDFAGWYENELLMGEPYKFDGKTMPANNMVLYAKWTPPAYTVTFALNGGNAGEGNADAIYAPQRVEKGKMVERPADPVREGYRFAGWTRNEEPFNFNTQIVQNTVLTAQWISEGEYQLTYDPNGGQNQDGIEASQIVDSQQYADGAEAKLMAVPSDWTAPEEGTDFICWNTAADGTGTDYYPGDLYTMPDHDVTLYAKWAPCRKTTLTYDYNGGTKNGSEKTSETVEIAVPNEKYRIEKDGTDLTRDGYEFAGWSTVRDEQNEEKLLQAGVCIQVDTLNPDQNILYAQWKKCLVITVTKTVDGVMGDRTKDFQFTYTVDGKEPVWFTLKHGGSYQIKNVKRGSTVTITELSMAKDGYTTQVEVNGGKTTSNSYTCSGAAQDMTVCFTNTRNVVPPTGWTDNLGAFVSMIVLAVAGALGLFLMRRRGKELL